MTQAAHAVVPPETEPAPSRYVPSLDGLRAVSILLVVVSHLGYERLVPGAFGVTLFFFISGLLITDQLTTELRRTGTLNLRSFYLRRFLRLMPAGLTYLLVAGLVFTALGGRITAAGWLSALFYGGNYYELFAKYASTIPHVRHPFNIIWSLAIEEHYYLVWPALLLAVGTGRRGRLVVIVICAGSLLWRAFLYHHCFGPQPGGFCGVRIHDRLYKATDARLDSIAWGAGISLLAARDRRWLAWLAGARRLQALMAGVVLATFLIPGEWFRQVLRYSLQGAALAVLVPAIVSADSGVRRLLEHRAAIFVGRLSYSMYLWHWAAMSVADGLVFGHPWLWRALSVLLTVGLSLASYFAIERPMLRLRRRFGSHAAA
jgi:peptidoglycan/LPS O-acetylase OafA/YrhL